MENCATTEEAMLRLEEYTDDSLMISLDDKILQIIRRHEPQNFKNFAEISLEGSALVHIVDWKNTKVVIKKLVKSSMKEAINEICLTGLISPYPNIITFYGVTKLKEILNGVREKPIPNTNVKFIELYQKCWEHEPDKRPNIRQVNSELSSIDSENNNNVCTVFYSKEKKTSEEIEIEDSDLSNCDKECDLNAIMTFQDS
ncbi:unnamed protein product [Rhizophagus irregularis]|nr:unnamed protein product [Rhizophagus irregularis]